MGCNYYLRKNECKHCNRYDDIHIGKSSAGWTFSFRGYKDYDYKDNGFDNPVISWKDWKEILRKEDNIYDEYNQKISFKEFEKLVESKKEQPNNHVTYCEKEYADTDYLNHLWLDEEGNSFSDSEFS